MIDMSEDSDHVFNLDLLDQEKIYCQSEILTMYNKDLLTEEQVAKRLVELKKTVKKAHDAISEFHNLTVPEFYWSGKDFG
jgi:hypothetical protein